MIISSPVEKEIFFTLCERVNLVFSVCSNNRETNSFPLIEEKAVFNERDLYYYGKE